MGRFVDLLGTVFDKFKLGTAGPQIKNNSGVVEARDSADSLYADVRALVMRVTGNSVILNEQASGSGASWKFTVSRPSTGMTHDLEVVMPSGDPAPGQALTVASFAGNVITLQYTTIAAGNDKPVVDTTNIVFGSSSPVAMFTLPQNARILFVQIIIKTAFNGTPSGSVGVSGTPAKYVGSTAFDLTYAAGTVFDLVPGVEPNTSSTEALIFTYSAGGASAGEANVLVYYAIPS